MATSRILKLLGVLALLGPCAGCCCHHKKGITLRGGLDFREYKKPAGFVELVDTGWDERRRMQDLRWLENADFSETSAPSVPVPTPDTTIPPAPPVEETPMLEEPPPFQTPPKPEPVPPAPDPEPEPQMQMNEQFELDQEVDEFESSATLPTSYSEEADFQRVLEWTRYEQPARSVSNQRTAIAPTSTAEASPGSSNWLWSKP